jgi:heme exporter protein C
MMLRNYTADEQRGARFAAVFAIVGFLDVPIVYFSIRWWRTIHPKPVIMGGEGSGLHPDMRYTLMISMVTFLLLMGFLLIQRVRLEKTQVELDNLKRELAY